MKREFVTNHLFDKFDRAYGKERDRCGRQIATSMGDLIHLAEKYNTLWVFADQMKLFSLRLSCSAYSVFVMFKKSAQNYKYLKKK